MIKAITVIFGVFCGAFVGFMLGVLSAVCLGLFSKWANPDDASAGLISILAIGTGPAGAVFGAILGGLAMAQRPRLFLVTFLPLAMLFAGWIALVRTLKSIDRPRTFVLAVSGTPGAKYIGHVSVDGKVQKINDTLPATFQFEGFHLESAFALASGNDKDEISVRVYANGTDLRTGRASQTGIYQEFKSKGYSEFFGGTKRFWSRMSSEEVNRFIQEGVVPSDDFVQ